MKIHKKTIFAFAAALITLSLLTACGTTRTDFDKGYDLGSSDIAKRQYWAQESLQKERSNLQKNNQLERYKIVTVPVEGKASDGSNISSHYVNVRVIDR